MKLSLRIRIAAAAVAYTMFVTTTAQAGEVLTDAGLTQQEEAAVTEETNLSPTA